MTWVLWTLLAMAGMFVLGTLIGRWLHRVSSRYPLVEDVDDDGIP